MIPNGILNLEGGEFFIRIFAMILPTLYQSIKKIIPFFEKSCQRRPDICDCRIKSWLHYAHLMLRSQLKLQNETISQINLKNFSSLESILKVDFYLSIEKSQKRSFQEVFHEGYSTFLPLQEAPPPHMNSKIIKITGFLSFSRCIRKLEFFFFSEG